MVHPMFGKYAQKIQFIELVDAPEQHPPFPDVQVRLKTHNVPCIWFVYKTVTQPLLNRRDKLKCFSTWFSILVLQTLNDH